MRTSKNNSSANTSREPYGPVTTLEQVPIAFYEILDLAQRSPSPEGQQIEALIKDVITITQTQPLSDLANRRIASEYLPHVADIPAVWKAGRCQ